MSENDFLPPLTPSDEEQSAEIMGDALVMWTMNSSNFFQDQKRKVREIAWGPFLFGITEYLPKAWMEILVTSGLTERSRLESLGPLSEDEQITLSFAEHLLERCVELMNNKSDLKTILNFIHDVEERPSSLRGVIDLNYAQREISGMHIFTSVWASLRRIYIKKKKSHAAVCVIYFFKIIQQQLLHYGQNGIDKTEFTKEKILFHRKRQLASSGGPDIPAESYCNSANRAFKQRDYKQALSDYTQAIMRNPFDSTFMSNRAQAHLNLKMYKEAYWDSRRAIILDPNNSKNYYRCASACIEFGWFDDAKDMNEKSLDNSHRAEERTAIQKQARLIEERKEQSQQRRRKPKEQKAPEKEVAYTCTENINFRKLLINGSNQFQRRQYQQSVEAFQQALDNVTELGVERLRIEKEDVLVITYILGMALVEVGMSPSLLSAIDRFSSILSEEKKEFPAAFYGIVKAYFRLNRFKEALDYAHQGLEVLRSMDKIDKEKIYLWPASDTVIEETKHAELKKLLKTQVTECSHPPKPDAFCQIHVDSENPRQAIYFNDHDFKGFVRLTCRAHCSLDYHASCWKAFKSSLSEKHTDKTMIDTKCPTPDCGSTISTISIYRTEEPHQFVSNLKDSPKVSRPVVKQKQTDPAKLRKKEEEKKQRKQKKAEAIEKKRQEEREKEEQERAKQESPATLSYNDAEAKCVYKGKATVLLKDEPEVLLEGKQKTSKTKKKKDKSKQVLNVDLQFRGDKDKTLVSAASLNTDGDFVSNSFGLLPAPGTAVWPLGNGLLPVPSSVPPPDETANSLYEFFADFLSANGPQDIDNPLLRDWMSDFPEEAMRKIDSYGGLENFIQANKRFTVVRGRILSRVEDQARAAAMIGGLLMNGKTPSPFFPTSRTQPSSLANPGSGLASWLTAVEPKKPAFSWEERAKQQNQSLTLISESISVPASSAASAWHSIDAISPQRPVRKGTSSTDTLDAFSKAWKDLPPAPDNAKDSSEDGFITVSKKKSKNSSEAPSSAPFVNSQVNPPLPMMKTRGFNFLARAEAAAKLDLTMIDNVVDRNVGGQEPPSSKAQEASSVPARVFRDDVSDVTTHSSDSASVMDMIEELYATEPSLVDSRGNSGSVRSDKGEPSLPEERLSFNGPSQGVGSNFYPPKPFAGGITSSPTPDTILALGSRRNSDASIRSDDIQRSSSPASQGSSGSGQSQPAPLKPLKGLAGIRRGKGKSSQKSKTSNLVKSEHSSLTVSTSNTDLSDSALSNKSIETESSSRNSNGGDLNAFILEEVFNTKDNLKADGGLSNGSSSEKAILSKLMEPPQNSFKSIWELDHQPKPNLASHESSESEESGRDSISSKRSLKEIWSMGNIGESNDEESKNTFPTSDPFSKSKPLSASSSDAPTTFMPSFADTFCSTDGGLIGKPSTFENILEGSDDISWPLNLSSKVNFDTEISANPLSGSVLGPESSIWGGLASMVPSVSTNDLSEPISSLLHTPLGSAESLSSTEKIIKPPSPSIDPSMPSFHRDPSPSSSTELSSNLNPFSKEFVPGTSLIADMTGKASSPMSKFNAHDLQIKNDKPETKDVDVNTTVTLDQIEKVLTGLEKHTKIIETLKECLETEKKDKDKLMISFQESKKEGLEKDVLLEKMKQANLKYEKQIQAVENQMSELKKQKAKDQKRAIESEKKFLLMMSQLLAQKLKSRKADGQKHLQQLTQVVERMILFPPLIQHHHHFPSLSLLKPSILTVTTSQRSVLGDLNNTKTLMSCLYIPSLKAQGGHPVPTIVTKVKEWETFDEQCDVQLQTLSALYGRYTDVISQGMPLDDLPDITTKVSIPEMPKPPSWEDVREASLSASSQESTQSIANEASSQSAMLRASHKSATTAASSEVKTASTSSQVQHQGPPGFKRMAPLTLPQRQRFPKTSSLASQLSGKSPPTPYEQIMSDLQMSFPTLSRADISRMIEDLRHARGGQLSQMNVRQISEELSVMASEQKDNQMGSNHDAVLGDVINISRRNTDEDLCPICHEELSCMERQSLQCSHTFHDQCIKQWFQHQRSCPVCRVHSLLPEEFPSLT